MADFKVEGLEYNDLTEEEREDVSDNGCGKEYARYIKVVHNGVTLMLENDAMEPEDATFARDLSWIAGMIQRAYELGKEAI